MVVAKNVGQHHDILRKMTSKTEVNTSVVITYTTGPFLSPKSLPCYTDIIFPKNNHALQS